jgi:hypothetical protein
MDVGGAIHRLGSARRVLLLTLILLPLSPFGWLVSWAGRLRTMFLSFPLLRDRLLLPPLLLLLLFKPLDILGLLRRLLLFKPPDKLVGLLRMLLGHV